MQLYKNEMENKAEGKIFNILYDILDDVVFGYATVGRIPNDHGKIERGVLKLRLYTHHSEKEIREMIAKYLERYGNAPQKLREMRKYFVKRGLLKGKRVEIFFDRETKELEWRVLFGDSLVIDSGKLVVRYDSLDEIFEKL